MLPLICVLILAGYGCASFGLGRQSDQTEKVDHRRAAFLFASKRDEGVIGRAAEPRAIWVEAGGNADGGNGGEQDLPQHGRVFLRVASGRIFGPLKGFLEESLLID